MTEKCCGFCYDRSNITGKCMMTNKKVKFNDCCENFVPMDLEFKR